jgi:hypothetical protein
MNYKKEDDGEKDGGIEKRRVFLVSLITFAIFWTIASLGTATRKGVCVFLRTESSYCDPDRDRDLQRRKKKVNEKNETRVNTHRRLLPLRDRFLERRGERDRERVL